MTYNRNDFTSGADTFGFGGEIISLASTDYTVPDTVKAIIVVNAGTVIIRAPDSASDITITSAPVGFVIPWHCSIIRRTGTTATLATIIGR